MKGAAQPLSSQALSRLQAASDALQMGRPAEARLLLAPVIAEAPRLAEAQRLDGLALRGEGDLAGAEAAFRAAVSADKRNILAHVGLADTLAALGRASEAERAYRAALALDRRLPPAVSGLSKLLAAQLRWAEAAQVTTPLAAQPAADEVVLTLHANALKGLGRYDEAVAFNQRAVQSAPSSAVAEHNLAATLGDLLRSAEAEAATTRALAKGGRAPETWIVRARALSALDRFDEADAAYREAIARRRDYVDAHRELAQLVWMRTEDADAAVAELNLVLKTRPDMSMLRVQRARVLEYAGRYEAAYADLQEGLRLAPDVLELQVSAAHMAVLTGSPAAALVHAERAVAIAPAQRAGRLILCEAALAAGDAPRVAAVAETLRGETPLDQYVIALQATAWRLLGDPRYGELFDYAALVRPWRLDTPEGWPSLGSYLADLTTALERRHPLRTHPLDQSLRHGTQASDLHASDDPAIVAFFKATAGPIRRHLAALGRGRDPVRSRTGRGFDYAGVWSVRLRPDGFHTDHVHPQGWLSSACYVSLPCATAGSPGREGWIKFGQPGVSTQPALPAEHFVEPEPGMLVLFPSYMWHGTVPFSGDGHRLTVAFDLVPGS